MPILTNVKCNKTIDQIQNSMELFDGFDKVYLFGSVLEEESIPNDVDILLIYSEYSYSIIEQINNIKTTLEKSLDLSVDLTVLSVEEVLETQFLKKISKRCLSLK